MIEEILELGILVDELDSNMMSQRVNETNLDLIKKIEDCYKSIRGEKLANDEVIPLMYTESNYYALLMRIAQEDFDKVKSYSIKLKKFDDFANAAIEIKVERIRLYRQALDLHQSGGSAITPEYMAQISTNLGNLYHEMGRIVESIEVLSKTFADVNEFPMALGNHGLKLYTLATYPISNEIQKYLINSALEDLNSMLEKACESDSISVEHISLFEEWKSSIESSLVNLSEVNAWEASSDVDHSYKNWCAKKRLSLNYINIVSDQGNVDNIHIPNMGISYFNEDNGKMTYYSWFNTIKQEFNLSRYNMYLIDKSESDLHESQQFNVLINTSDYPALGYKTELLKTALRAAYGILDKIGLFCSHFFRVKTKPGRIDFNKWYKEVEMEVALDSPFNALYWLSNDLDFRTGYFKDIRRLRNVIEHRYLRVLDYYKVPISEELEDTDKYEYTVGYQELYSITMDTLNLVRSAIFYMVNGFNVLYKNAVYGNQEGKIFLPLYLDVYDDEWKN
ncbi:LA2681 family HEPN domain-containing protein [Bacillus swezeyi]|uniref:LA2681 family HEPN domain-containing protein n=1 Tax=Bacillus swezeyi TaxID=1925020 RepID=UPI002E1E8D32|nr:LA2681 family HEPN domain-containing protein [Bacillus swezeyi]